MFARPSHWLRVISLLLLVSCVGCATASATPSTRAATPAASSPSNATAMALANNTSTAHFTFAGGQTASYTLQTTTPASELRHGHREFTILLKDNGISLFIVFYGYQGPGNYTLMDALNGGDIHIGFEHDTISWDLLMQPRAHCSLSVTSDTPIGNTGLDRMRGTFICPLLLSSSPSHPQKPVTLSSGSFDIAILVAS
ncbi:MAG TPA: hypothetical protein VGM01_01995 [Ktedonobacteraceae bacterium]